MAIWLAIKLGYNLVGVVTSFGNTTLENVTTNTAGILSFIDADHIPLLKGVSEPSSIHAGYKNIVLPRQALSGNGLCNLEFPTTRHNHQKSTSIEEFADFMCDNAQKNGKLDYIILGPATNFAKLCKHMGDEIHDVINSVVMLGGKIDELWRLNPTADFNIICDPSSVADILQTTLTKKFITLDTTWDISISLNDIKTLMAKGKIGLKTKEIMEVFCQYFAPEPIFRFHDPSVILLYNKDDYIETSVTINLDETSREYGRLSHDESFGAKVEIYNYNSLDRISLRNKMLNLLELFDC